MNIPKCYEMNLQNYFFSKLSYFCFVKGFTGSFMFEFVMCLLTVHFGSPIWVFYSELGLEINKSELIRMYLVTTFMSNAENIELNTLQTEYKQ